MPTNTLFKRKFKVNLKKKHLLMCFLNIFIVLAQLFNVFSAKFNCLVKTVLFLINYLPNEKSLLGLVVWF